ncbi:hypothetical protein BDW62DRAFT_215696 [Aspergillus aurantiobrunneus]
MASLRKACRNCTASKRKCVVQLPKCTRCAQRGLECTYDLEPLNAPVVLPQESPIFTWNPSACDNPGYCLMKRVRTRPSDIDPAICQPGHQDTLDFFRLGYQPVPDLVKSGKPAIFVHPKLHMHDNYNHVASLVEAGKGVSYESFKRLIELDVNVVPIKEALTALQALIIHLATFLLEEKQINVDLFLNVVLEWTQALLASAQTRMPPDRSSWQTWLFGESVRRTIIMSYVLAMSLSSFKYGYCSHWLFLESLPFDKRAGLWMAESPQSWIAIARAKFGEEVGEQLISFHKFAESLNGSDVDFRGDSFLALLAYGHNGVEQRTHSLPSGN